MQILKGTGKRFSFFSKQKQISTNFLIENPKSQNKNESNLNLSNKNSVKSKISYPDLKKWKKKNLPVSILTIWVVDRWPNGFFLCLLFWWSKFGQGMNNHQRLYHQKRYRGIIWNQSIQRKRINLSNFFFFFKGKRRTLEN